MLRKKTECLLWKIEPAWNPFNCSAPDFTLYLLIVLPPQSGLSGKFSYGPPPCSVQPATRTIFHVVWHSSILHPWPIKPAIMNINYIAVSGVEAFLFEAMLCYDNYLEQ